MQSLPPNDIFVFAEEASQFATNERNNVLMANKKKKRSVNPPISVKKDVTPSAREIKKSSSPESLYNNTVNLTTIEYDSEGKHQVQN
ncbi:hypothetical protein TNCV_4545471 [Trichonephila clavipes]|nr:hypothetical protein TNCV_4545471 [Trichonephila clavipes]